MEPTTQYADEPRTIAVTLASGRPWEMPEHIARQVIESLARAHPKTFGEHLQAALMGTEIPTRRTRGQSS